MSIRAFIDKSESRIIGVSARQVIRFGGLGVQVKYSLACREGPS